MLKSPEDCRNMQEIRTAIDAIGHEIIAAIGARAAYVTSAARFKTSPAALRDDERLRSMLEQRRAWAVAAGLDPDLIAALYRQLVTYFIHKELRQWQTNR